MKIIVTLLLCLGMAAEAQITHSAIPCKMGDCAVGSLSGTGASGRLALWSSASGLTSDAGLMYSGTGAAGIVSSGGFASGGSGYILTTSDILKWWGGSSYDLSLSRISAGVVGVGTGAAGSTAGSAALVGIQGARTKTVTDATPTAYASFTIADGAMYSGEILYSCKSVKGTALQIASGRIRFAATREGSTYTTQVNTVGTELVAAAAGTLACTMTIAGAAGVVTLTASCDTDQASPDSMTLRYQFDALDPAIAITGL